MNWIFRLCLMNMKRRIVRTILTILGVTIGVVSVVSLVSLGLGLKQQILGSAGQANVKQITVQGNTSGKRKNTMLTDRSIEKLSQIDNVKSIYPVYNVDMNLTVDHKYTSYTSIQGIPSEKFKKLKVKYGTTERKSQNKPELVLGGNMDNMFYSDKGKSYKEDEDKRTKDMLGMRLSATVSMDEDNSVTDTLQVIGTMKESKDDYSEDSQSIYCDLDVLIPYLKRMSVGAPEGQPTDENGVLISKDWVYSSAIITVDELEHVDNVVKNLQDMGFETYNQKEMLDSMKKEAKVLQLFLISIGMIALIVAVIGISNTMTTSVYDRINEIGILKVLGCDMDELVFLFLLEAGILGFVGGVVGVVLSCGANGILNKIAVSALEMKKETHITLLPWWLVLGSILFSTLFGILAGFIPAKWASKLKPIDTVGK